MSVFPKISVIIPVYNIELYLSECLDSVLTQTFKDFEVICVDDGSTDGSSGILKIYADKDPRITVIHQENAGPAVARNTGIGRAKGEYVLFVDSDDTIHPELCEKVVAVADREQADMTFFFYTADHVSDSQLEKAGAIILANEIFDAENQPLRDNQLFLYCFTTPWNRLIRKGYLEKHRIRFADVSGEDIAFVWESLLFSPRIVMVPEKLYFCRTVSSSISRDLKRGYRNQAYRMYDYMESVINNQEKMNDAWKNLFYGMKLSNLFDVYLKTLPQFRKEVLNSIKNSIGREERIHLRQSGELPIHVKNFYLALDGNQIAYLKNIMFLFAWRFRERFRHGIKNAANIK